MMLTVLSMAPLHFKGQENGNEVQHDFIGHMTPLASVSVSYDADTIINAISVCLSQDNQNEVKHEFLVM